LPQMLKPSYIVLKPSFFLSSSSVVVKAASKPSSGSSACGIRSRSTSSSSLSSRIRTASLSVPVSFPPLLFWIGGFCLNVLFLTRRECGVLISVRNIETSKSSKPCQKPFSTDE
jgi:hypothetical protein